MLAYQLPANHGRVGTLFASGNTSLTDGVQEACVSVYMLTYEAPQPIRIGERLCDVRVYDFAQIKYFEYTLCVRMSAQPSDIRWTS